jgi:hypothetical protein
MRELDCLPAQFSQDRDATRRLCGYQHEASEQERSVPDRELDAVLRPPLAVGAGTRCRARQPHSIPFELGEQTVEGEGLEPTRPQPEPGLDRPTQIVDAPAMGRQVDGGRRGSEHVPFYISGGAVTPRAYAFFARAVPILTRP